MGEYRENLKTGGELVVNKYNWYISYYFAGPDLRYNGCFLSIPSEKIDKYISAWKNNYSAYLKLKKDKEKLNLNGSLSKVGEEQMRISAGGYYDGVCIDGYHKNIKNQREIDCIVADYTRAKTRAVAIQKMIRDL